MPPGPVSGPFVSVVTSPGVLWMLCILGLFLRMLVRPAENAAPKIIIMILVLAFEPFSIVAVMNAENRAIPMKFDYYLYLIDNGLGLSSFWVARSLTEGQRSVLLLIYKSLAAVMIVWYGINLLRRDGRPRRLLAAYIITYLVGPCLYLIVPACGPRHAFGSAFPYGNPSVLPVLVPINYWPNAIPSLHVATAILFVFFAGRSLPLRGLAWVYLSATAVATLAFEHYVIDLVVAVPFACFAASAARSRFASALANLTVAGAWLVSIRFDTPGLISHPPLLKVLALATLAIAVISLWSGQEHGWPGSFRWRPRMPAPVVASPPHVAGG
jgi:hypothetical protein